MAAPSGAGLETTARLGRMARWWLRTRDSPELLVLFGMVSSAVGIGVYTIKKTLLNNEAGAYWNIAMRGDIDKQVETARAGWEDPAAGKHSLPWHVAQIQIDKDGANIGIPPFDNRMRPHQYSMAAGISA